MRNIPTVTKNLLIINVIVFIVSMAIGQVVDLNDIFGLHFFLASDFQLYQLITYMFLHAGWMHLFFNMFALWMFGCVVENVWGPRKFLLFYLVCGIGAGVSQEVAQFFQFYSVAAEQIPGFNLTDVSRVAAVNDSMINLWTTVGASGAIYAILLAFGMTFPEERIFIFPLPIPIKAKWFVMLYAGVEIFAVLGVSNDNVAHLAHLGGMLFGYFLIRYWRKHPGRRYGRDSGQQFFDNLKSAWERRSRKNAGTTSGGWQSNSTTSSNPDWDYNARKKARQEEMDRILDKIKRSGYDSLTKEEKDRLFDISNDK